MISREKAQWPENVKCVGIVGGLLNVKQAYARKGSIIENCELWSDNWKVAKCEK